MRYNYFLLILFVSSIVLMSFVSASTEDTQQPITIEADRAELDEKNNISTYLGNVILQQGNIHIKAEKLFVYTKDGQMIRIKAEGKPIELSQQRENLDDIRGSSLLMEYDAETKLFLLLKEAELWQGKNKFSGERIQFDAEKEKVVASGSPEGSGETGQRVQITIHPTSENTPSTDNQQ